MNAFAPYLLGQAPFLDGLEAELEEKFLYQCQGKNLLDPEFLCFLHAFLDKFLPPPFPAHGLVHGKRFHFSEVIPDNVERHTSLDLAVELKDVKVANVIIEIVERTREHQVLLGVMVNQGVYEFHVADLSFSYHKAKNYSRKPASIQINCKITEIFADFVRDIGRKESAMHILAHSKAAALRALYANNIGVTIRGYRVEKASDLRKIVNEINSSGKGEHLHLKNVAISLKSAGYYPVIGALKSKGTEVVDIEKQFRPEKIWSEDLYKAIQNIVVFVKDRSPKDEQIIKQSRRILDGFQRFAVSAGTPAEHNLIDMTLFDVVEIHDPYTAYHNVQVSIGAKAICRQMGFPDSDVGMIGRAAKFHDFGKIGVSKEILNKLGPLDKDEYDQVKTHVMYGYSILKDCGWPEEILKIILNHHYVKGYPEGIDPKNPPPGAKILVVADAIGGGTAGRYKKSKKKIADVIGELRNPPAEYSVIQPYDPKVISVFEEALNSDETLLQNYPRE